MLKEKFSYKKIIFSILLVGIMSFFIHQMVFAIDLGFEGNIYENKENQFSIYFPKDWKIEEDPSSISLVKAKSDYVVISINSAPYTSESPELDEDFMMSGLQGKGARLEMLESGDMQVSGIKAKTVELMAAYPASEPTIFMYKYMVAFVKQEMGYLISVVAYGESESQAMEIFGDNEEIIMGVVNSFQFEDDRYDSDSTLNKVESDYESQGMRQPERDTKELSWGRAMFEAFKEEFFKVILTALVLGILILPLWKFFRARKSSNKKHRGTRYSEDNDIRKHKD